MKRIWMILVLALLMTVSCIACAGSAQPESGPGETVQADPEAPPKYEAPEYASSAVNELFQQLLDAGCPTNSAEQVGAWLDTRPDYMDTVQGTSCEYAGMENGVERVRFLKTGCDRFSRYDAAASETVVYQLWLVDGEVREGASGVLTPLKTEDRLDEGHELAGFYIGQPTWEIDLNTLDGFYAVEAEKLTGFASECGWCDKQYSNGPVTLCFITSGMEYLVHVHVQSGDAAYLGVRLGDRVDDLIEAVEKQNDIPGEHWIIYRENYEAISYGYGIQYAEQDSHITELKLFAFV